MKVQIVINYSKSLKNQNYTLTKMSIIIINLFTLLGKSLELREDLINK